MYCISCGAQQRDGVRFCNKCGAEMKQPPVAAAAAAPQPVQPPVQAPIAPPQPMAGPVQAVAQPVAPPMPVVEPLAAPMPAPVPQAAPVAQAPAAPAQQSTAAYASLYNLKCPSCGSAEVQVQGVKGALGKSMATGLAFGAIGNLVAGNSASKNMATEPIEYKCGCGNKFQSMPHVAGADEILPQPCTVQFERLSSFVGGAVPQIVYLNGEKMGPVKNGKTLTLTTHLRYNTVFVTDQHGLAFKDMLRFEAQPQGMVSVRFNRKFMR